LISWVQDQIGRGGDDSPRVERDVYVIKLGLILEDDSFCTESDTGNKGLTCGIVMAVFGDLGSPSPSYRVKSLSERPKAA
jgi:hypothetical protein